MMGAIASALAAGVVTAELAAPVSAAAIALAIAGGAAVGSATGAIQAAMGAAIVAATALSATPFAAGGIVMGPTFAMLGETGPEAVVPLRGGMLPSSTTVNVVNAHPSAKLDVKERRGNRGGRIVDVTIRESVRGHFERGEFAAQGFRPRPVER